jgi:2-oxoglutarate ferredoxin oxidoreductase subunit delta
MKYWRTPLDANEIKVSRGIVHIIEERCKECGYCIAYCPRDVLELSPRYNSKGYHPPAVKKPEACVNCHYCEIICPDFAIYSVEAPSNSQPWSSQQAPAADSDDMPAPQAKRAGVLPSPKVTV